VRRKCFSCGRELIIGQIRYWQVDLSLKDPYSQNVWRGKAENVHAAFCEGCESDALLLYDKLEEAFKLIREV
jgi:hypothetical protein